MMIDIASTSGTLVSMVLNGRPTITYRQIRDSDFPTFIKAWFHLGVETWYAPEYQWRNTSIRFNYKDETVQRLLPDLDAAVKDSAVFSTEDCQRIVEGALAHEVAYLNHPIRALCGLLFQRSEVVDGIHVVNFLSHFNRESFYRDAAKRYVVEHDDTRLDIELLEQFLALSEADVYQSQPIEALKDSARAVSELLRLMDQNGHADIISVESWQTFAQARGLQEKVPEIWAKLQSRLGVATGISIDELVVLISEGGRPTALTTFGSEERPEEQTVVPIAFSSPAPEPFVVEPVGVPFTFSPPEPEPFMVEPVEPTSFALPTDYHASEVPQEEIEPVDAPSVPPEHPKKEELMGEAIANSITTTTPMAPPPMEINDKLQKMFVKKLFNKDEAAYLATVRELEPALSWEEAFSVIEETWQHRGLNLFSKESQEFTRVYYERYFPPT